MKHQKKQKESLEEQIRKLAEERDKVLIDLSRAQESLNAVIEDKNNKQASQQLMIASYEEQKDALTQEIHFIKSQMSEGMQLLQVLQKDLATVEEQKQNTYRDISSLTTEKNQIINQSEKCKRELNQLREAVQLAQELRQEVHADLEAQKSQLEGIKNNTTDIISFIDKQSLAMEERHLSLDHFEKQINRKERDLYIWKKRIETLHMELTKKPLKIKL